MSAIRKRALLALAMTSVAALSLVGCAAGESPNGDKIELNFVHSAYSDPLWGAAIDAFEDAHPGVTIKEQQIAFDDLSTQVQARLSSKDTSIDVIAVDGPRLANMAAQGFLRDLSDSRDEILASTGEFALKQVTYEDAQYAFSQWTSTNVMFYNKALLAAAGVEAPSADLADRLTWEQIVDDAKKAQAAGAKYGFSFEQVDRYYQLQPLFESAGAGSGLTGTGNLTPDITSAAWEKVAGWYGSLYADGVSPRGVPVEQLPDEFMSGNLAYLVAEPAHLQKFIDSGVDFGVAPMGYFDGGTPVTPTGSWTIGVSAFSEHGDIAAEFAKYITLDPEGASLVQLNGIPIQKDSLAAYISDLSTGGPIQSNLAGIIQGELAATPVARPSSVAYVDFEGIINAAFADIRNGEPVDAVLATANDKLDVAFARYQ
ncbi:hypothetical protein GCM10022239_02320 [Leifsonia bigeumensis]|uniref:Sugar ABC transporter substrate-binding protein n=1 Tax=Leifsonella bigeumensis TaxID=433643 RepID=A0ABP7F6C0_9MICO